jgi:hypothetical protein
LAIGAGPPASGQCLGGGERIRVSPGADVASPGGNVGTSIVGAPARNLVGFRALYGRASSVRLHVGEFCGRLAGAGERERARRSVDGRTDDGHARVQAYGFGSSYTARKPKTRIATVERASVSRLLMAAGVVTTLKTCDSR